MKIGKIILCDSGFILYLKYFKYLSPSYKFKVSKKFIENIIGIKL